MATILGLGVYADRVLRALSAALLVLYQGKVLALGRFVLQPLYAGVRSYDRCCREGGLLIQYMEV